MKESHFMVSDEADWSRVVPKIWEAAKGRNVWLLNGDLGSGKTTLTRFLINYLGGDMHVSSPTFSLINTYEWIHEDKEIQLHHLDLYRLESTEEVINIGFEELLNEGSLILIEWPELATPLLPEEYFEIHISHHEGSRKVLVL